MQTLALGPPGSLWGWLAKMQTSGASLPRDLLAQRAANDKQLLIFICKAAGRLGGGAAATTGAEGAGAAASGGALAGFASRTYLSFYAVVLCEVLAVLRSVGEEALATLLPHLLAGLGPGAVQDYRAATLMAVAELCSRATLGRDFVKGECVNAGGAGGEARSRVGRALRAWDLVTLDVWRVGCAAGRRCGQGGGRPGQGADAGDEDLSYGEAPHPGALRDTSTVCIP